MKYILVLLMMFSQYAYAGNAVVIPFAAGTVMDQLCRKVFEIYDSMYNNESTMMNITGADQIIAHRHFLTLPNSALLCAGNRVGGFNQIIYPETSPAASTLRPVIGIISFSHFIFSPSNNQSLDSLFDTRKKQNKVVLVGGPSSNAVKILTHYLNKKNVPYEVVLYRKPVESIISLKEGTLDLYIDGGSIKHIVDSMPEIKEIAYVGIKHRSNSVNLYKSYPILGHLVSTAFIYVNSSASYNTTLELNERLFKVLNSKEMEQFYAERMSYHTPIHSTLREAELYINQIPRYAKDVYN